MRELLTEPLTKTERDVLRGLKKAIRLHGNPSLKEIAALAGRTYHAPSVHKYLRQLAAKGYVLMGEARRPRSIRLAPRKGAQ